MIPVFVISLEQSTDRRKTVAANLDGLGIPFTFLCACEGDGLSRYSRTYQRNLTAGEIGCYLSHIRAASMIAASKNEFACVLEDDAVLSSDALSFLKYETLLSLGEFDVLRLEAKFHGRHKTISTINEFKVLAPLYPDGGTRAQIYSRSGAVKIVRYAHRIDEPIDVYLYFDPPIRRFRILDVSPACACESKSISLIGDRKNASKTSRYRRLRYKVRRRLNYALAWSTFHP